MQALRPTLVTEEEFLALPESMNKVELLDGEVLLSPAPTPRHQRLAFGLAYALETWARARTEPAFVGISPCDIRFAPDRILQPDVFVILGEVRLDQPGPLSHIPDLCIEVLSQDRVMDRVTKRLIYAAAGVREYWVVETTGVVERWHGDGLSQADEIGGILESPLLPGFSLDVRTLVPPT
jgi:Uma2 family endonuclease